MEINYKAGQRVKSAPVIRKTGALGPGMEQTPVVFKGRLILIESVHETARDSESPGKVYFRAHDYAAGRVYPAFARGVYFASAYCENDTVYAFGTAARDDRPMTMYQPDTKEEEWHDCRGGRDIIMFWSSDLVNWQEKKILHIPEWRLWNTSVCKGPEGYVMAFEVSSNREWEYTDPVIGRPFTAFFARSADLMNWTRMDNDCCYTRERYNACPALRYADGRYYMICLEYLPASRYASYIYRTQNFKDWEVGVHNPVMMYGDADRKAHRYSRLTKEEKKLLKTGLNINNSDIDLCEFEGKTYIYYANGDQQRYSFLCEAVYDGPMNKFLKAFFE